MNPFADYKEERLMQWYSIALLMIVAYAFSFAVRMIWVYQMGDVPYYYWNDEIMINTNDGYYFASAAKSFLDGTYQHNPQIPGAFLNYPAVIYLTAFAAKYLPFSFETVILYMPAVVSSLIVIPLILIGRMLRLPLLGFFSALIASIGWSYYNRTMVGYYDSDMFSVLMQMLVLYAMLRLIVNHRVSDAIIAFAFIVTYPYFYPQGLSLIYGMYIIYIGYAVVYLRKNEAVYFGIAAIAIALMTFPLWAKLALLAGAWLVFRARGLNHQYRMIAGFLFFAFFLVEANVFGLIFSKVMGYLSRGTEESGLHFYQVIQTVREAGTIPFSTMANRISGSTAGVIASLIGYILLVYKKREMIIALPLIGIGVFSLWGGLRFTVYAVPVAAISVVFLFYFLGDSMKKPVLRYTLIAGLTAAMLYPNIQHILGYRVPTVFMTHEVEPLQKLSAIGSDKDYVIAWWDYGYPLWYYGNKNTLIDGSKHHHDNFIVSQIFSTSSQKEAARLARAAIESYVASDYKVAADTLFKNGEPDQVDVNAYLETLRYAEVTLPEATRDIYFYIPLRMLDIFPTVQTFSNLDLNTGQQYARPFMMVSTRFKDTPTMIDLGRGAALDKQKGMILLGQNEIPLKAYYKVEGHQSGSVKTDSHLVNMQGRLSLVYMPEYGRFLLLDDTVLNSTFIQMFVFENYDPELFEPVVMSPFVKIYKLKI